MENEIEREREHHAEFLERHQKFYDELVKIMADCIERDDVKELSLHVAYLTKCIEVGLNIGLGMQRQEQAQSGNA